jgi:hypothetical protein
MRKRLIDSASEPTAADTGEWLDLAPIAEIEMTSEAEGSPIESALAGSDGPGWRAAAPGEQLVRVVFDEPRRLERIRLVFDEPELERTQEFVLRWSADRDAPAREIVRQQWTFHPPSATREVEDYRVGLSGVRVLELAIAPDIAGGSATASLRSMRLA